MENITIVGLILAVLTPFSVAVMSIIFWIMNRDDHSGTLSIVWVIITIIVLVLVVYLYRLQKRHEQEQQELENNVNNQIIGFINPRKINIIIG